METRASRLIGRWCKVRAAQDVSRCLSTASFLIARCGPPSREHVLQSWVGTSTRSPDPLAKLSE
eukprot:1202791-Alexandrium_andersonii.AAC.1